MLEFENDGSIMKSLISLVDTSKHYIWFILIAIMGGTANYVRRVQSGEVPRFSTAELLGEWLISGFVALMTAYLCLEMGVSWHITAFACGITGHMGGRAIFVFEVMVLRKLNSKLPEQGKDKK